MTVDIIGGGIGGLTTAIALHQKGINFRLFEQAPEMKPVGAGILLANNAMQIFRKLGLYETILEAGNRIERLLVTDAQLNPFSTMQVGTFAEKYGVQAVSIHRGMLQQILLDQLPEERVYLDHQLRSIKHGKDISVLEFDCQTISSEVIIGADGINSVVRDSIFPGSEIRDAKQICWRGVLEYDLPPSYQHDLNEVWDRQGRFGFLKIAPGKVYWYALKDVSNEKTNKNNLAMEFITFHPLIHDLIQSTSLAQIHEAIITDLAPISQWYEGNICLLGDAAHATTPNMGQGACQAIEDAFVLASCLEKYSYDEAFQHYQHLRKEKAEYVVNTSWKIGKVSHWKNPVAIAFRNQLMRWTPEKTALKTSSRLFDTNYDI